MWSSLLLKLVLEALAESSTIRLRLSVDVHARC
jgi:hypothetical protein